MIPRRLALSILAAGLLPVLACGGGGAPAAPTAAPPAAKPAIQATTAPAAPAGSPAAAQPSTPAASPAAKAAAPAPASPVAKAASPAPGAKSAGPALKSPTKVQFTATSTAMTYAPFWIALSKGYFKDENLELDIIFGGSGAKQLTTIATGSAVLGFFDPSDSVKPIQLGQPIVAIGNLYAEPYFMLAVKQEVLAKTGVTRGSPLRDRAAALKGLKIGTTTPGSGSDRYIRSLLQTAGLNPERDAEIVTTGSSANMVAAYARGSLDALTTVSPFIDEAMVRFKAVLLISQPAGDVSEDRKGMPGFLFWGHKPSLQQNPDVPIAMMKGVIRAMDLMQQQPEEAKTAYVDAITKTSDSPPPTKEIIDAGWETNKNGFAKDPALTREMFQKLINYATEVEGEKFNVTPEQMFDMTYVNEAKRQLGR